MAAPIGFPQNAKPIWFIELELSKGEFTQSNISSLFFGPYRLIKTANYYIVVGSSGYILRSTSLAGPWTQVYQQPSGYEFYDVAFIGTTVIAVGQLGAVAISSNEGASWSSVTSFTTDFIYAITSNATTFVVASFNGSVFYSNNLGVSWQTSALPATTDQRQIIDIIWTGSSFVIVGGAYTATDSEGFIGRSTPSLAMIMTSSNGASFTNITGLNSYEIQSIASSGTQLVAVTYRGEILYTSTLTGASGWTRLAPEIFASQDLRRIVYGNGLFAVYSQSGKVFTFNNTFVPNEIGPLPGLVYGLYYENNLFYFLAWSGSNPVLMSSNLAGPNYLRVTTAPINLTFNGNLFTSDQRITGIGRATQSLKNDGAPFSLQFAGEDVTLRDLLRSYNLQGNKIKVWVSHVLDDTWSTFGASAGWYFGYINTLSWDVNVPSNLKGEPAYTMTINCVDISQRLKEGLAGRPATPQGMRFWYPDDSSHDQLPAERDRVLLLGKGVQQ